MKQLRGGILLWLHFHSCVLFWVFLSDDTIVDLTLLKTAKKIVTNLLWLVIMVVVQTATIPLEGFGKRVGGGGFLPVSRLVQVPNKNSLTHSHPFFVAAEDYNPEVETRVVTCSGLTHKSDSCDCPPSFHRRVTPVTLAPNPNIRTVSSNLNSIYSWWKPGLFFL